MIKLQKNKRHCFAVFSLLDGTFFNAYDDCLATPLRMACHKGDFVAVKILLKAGSYPHGRLKYTFILQDLLQLIIQSLCQRSKASDDRLVDLTVDTLTGYLNTFQLLVTVCEVSIVKRMLEDLEIFKHWNIHQDILANAEYLNQFSLLKEKNINLKKFILAHIPSAILAKAQNAPRIKGPLE